jgi:hypothetical protein
MFAAMHDLATINLAEPAHQQVIGLVLSDRDPPSPMAAALLASVMKNEIAFDFSQPRKS